MLSFLLRCFHFSYYVAALSPMLLLLLQYCCSSFNIAAPSSMLPLHLDVASPPSILTLQRVSEMRMVICRKEQSSWWPPPLMLPLLLWCFHFTLILPFLFGHSSNVADFSLMFPLYIDMAIPPLPLLQCFWSFFDVDELWWVDSFWFFPPVAMAKSDIVAASPLSFMSLKYLWSRQQYHRIAGALYPLLRNG